MKPLLMLGVASIIVLLSIGFDVSPPAIPHADLVSFTRYDIDNDQQDEIREILLVEGQRYVDKMLWCGMGDKWEGQFVIQVRKGATILSRHSLNDLMGLEQLFFCAPEFQLVLQDYNQDGRPDFNLGQYSSCNGSRGISFSQLDPMEEYPESTVTRDSSSHTRTRQTSSSSATAMLDRFKCYSHNTTSHVTAWYCWDGANFVLAFTTESDFPTAEPCRAVAGKLP